MKKFDIRILKLNKWYVPKTHSLNGMGSQIVIGYFDDIEVIPVREECGNIHPFIEGYNQLVRWKQREKRKLVDHSSQEQLIFVNVSNQKETGFSEEEIEEFWEDKGWPYLFISMIHISHLGTIEEALKRIREVFGHDYLCYVSFDYCDLIIFAKKLYIRDYLDKIKKLFKNNGGKIFFDSFSMVSFNDSYLKMDDSEKKTNFEAGCEKDKFQATINLSIRNYELFKKWYDEIQTTAPLYNMFGRYDVSIVQEADTIWLLNIMEKLHDEKNQKIFWTFETFIKIQENDLEGYIIEPNPKTEKYYNFIKDTLGKKIDILYEIISNSSLMNKSNFILPICEVRDCICSIIKNNFAEELIYCIYESFYEFIEYMTKTISQLDDLEGKVSEKKIAECYDNYFTALNALVNSTMHSDRQFIQATTFNAIFYSVPPKIMALYNVYIYRLKKILMDKDVEKKISYLIYPSFSPEVSTEKISLDDVPPCERILKVKVNEKALYDISLVTYQLVHELAHSIGKNNRCRTLRMKNMFRALVRYIMEDCGITDDKIRKSFEKYLEEIWIKDNIGREYLDSFHKLSAQFLLSLSKAAQEIIPEYLEKIYKESFYKEENLYDELIGNMGIEDIPVQKQYLKYYLPQYCKQKGFLLSQKIEEIHEKKLSKEEYVNIVEILYNTYYECYADLQMILVLKVSPEDYLNMFLKKEEISVEELISDFEDVIRVCTIFKVMMDCGMWNMKNNNDSKVNDLMEIIRNYNNVVFAVFPDGEIQKRVECILSEIKQSLKLIKDTEAWFDNKVFGNNVDNFMNIEIMDLGVVNILLFDLYEYLLCVVKETLIEYQKDEKSKDIKEVQDYVKVMVGESDIIKVYNCIETELQKYGEKLFGV